MTISRVLYVATALVIASGCRDESVKSESSSDGSSSSTGMLLPAIDPSAATDVAGSTLTRMGSAMNPEGSAPDQGEGLPAKRPVKEEPDGEGGAGEQETKPPHIALQGAPLIFSPTASSFGINVVLSEGSPDDLNARVRRRGTIDYVPLEAPEHPAQSIAQWTASGLEAGTHYQYQIVLGDESAAGDESDVLFEGQALTQRRAGEDFSFALIADTHVPPPVAEAPQRDQIERTYRAVMGDIADLERPDFIINLGDMLDFNLYGFNAPPPSEDVARDAYMNYRTLMGPLLGQVAHFPVIGNWDGETGCFGPDVIQRSLSQRLRYMPAPGSTTYPEGGSADEDYYAFQWGDALFIVLNVMSYTPTCPEQTGKPEDWTLGAAQFAWLEKTLAEATSKWRFIMIHHVVGGAAANDWDSSYGRGGGQSAYVGEQALIHQMMLQAGVQIFFYGHDHAFTDMVVDGIHYTLPGSAGAPWKFDISETGYENSWPESGYSRVHVSSKEVSVEFIAEGGKELYSYFIPDPDHQSLNAPPPHPDTDAGPNPVEPDQRGGGHAGKRGGSE